MGASEVTLSGLVTIPQMSAHRAVLVKLGKTCLFQCERFTPHRQRLEEAMGGTVTETNLVNGMLESIQEKWGTQQKGISLDSIGNTKVPARHRLAVVPQQNSFTSRVVYYILRLILIILKQSFMTLGIKLLLIFNIIIRTKWLLKFSIESLQ